MRHAAVALGPTWLSLTRIGAKPIPIAPASNAPVARRRLPGNRSPAEITLLSCYGRWPLVESVDLPKLFALARLTARVGVPAGKSSRPDRSRRRWYRRCRRRRRPVRTSYRERPGGGDWRGPMAEESRAHPIAR